MLPAQPNTPARLANSKSFPLIRYFNWKSIVNLSCLVAYYLAKNSKFEFASKGILGNSCRIGHQDCRNPLLIEIQEENIYRSKRIDKFFRCKTKVQDSGFYKNWIYSRIKGLNKPSNDQNKLGWEYWKISYEFYWRWIGIWIASKYSVKQDRRIYEENNVRLLRGYKLLI